VCKPQAQPRYAPSRLISSPCSACFKWLRKTRPTEDQQHDQSSYPPRTSILLTSSQLRAASRTNWAQPHLDFLFLAPSSKRQSTYMEGFKLFTVSVNNSRDGSTTAKLCVLIYYYGYGVVRTHHASAHCGNIQLFDECWISKVFLTAVSISKTHILFTLLFTSDSSMEGCHSIFLSGPVQLESLWCSPRAAFESFACVLFSMDVILGGNNGRSLI
jgi:hypothetical protein